jgi:exodeoxyribonuclease VII small subunit
MRQPVVKKQPPSFEDQMQRLQDIVQALERADLPLEKNVSLYKEGRNLARSCRELLERARHEILLCGEDGEDVPFAPASGDDAATGRENGHGERRDT